MRLVSHLSNSGRSLAFSIDGQRFNDLGAYGGDAALSGVLAHGDVLYLGAERKAPPVWRRRTGGT